jgi:hypothetical protein
MIFLCEHPAAAGVPEPEYPANMLVRSVHHQRQIRWNKHEIFLSELLWENASVSCPSMFAQFSIARDVPGLNCQGCPRLFRSRNCFTGPFSGGRMT